MPPSGAFVMPRQASLTGLYARSAPGQASRPSVTIPSRKGVSVAVVRQRLRLGAVSPVLMTVYRKGKLTLEQLMAFTLTDDHARQEEVWEGLGYDDSAYAIRRMLTEGQVAMTDRRARFVGVEAYAEAGGVITRDLFDDENGGYLADAALLDRLVAAKLEREAEVVRREGWAWVTVSPEFDHRMTADLRRVYSVPAPLSAEAEQEVTALELEYNALADNIDNDVASDEATDRITVIEARLEELQGAPVFAADDIARGGAFVSVGYDGEVRIERGFIRKEDAAPVAEGGETAPDAKGVKSAKLPDRLVAQLTAHRTLALREAVANRPDVAFVAVVHALVVATFYPGGRVSCLEIRAGSALLAGHAPGIDESPLGRAAAEREEVLGASLPQNPEDLWEALAALPQERLMALLAHCAATTIDSVVRPKQSSSPPLKHVEALAQAVSLDMADHWQPTVSSYFGHVTKDTILAAVREAVSDDAARRLVILKKAAIAEAAEQLLMDKRWLPPSLRPSRSEASPPSIEGDI